LLAKSACPRAIEAASATIGFVGSAGRLKMTSFGSPL
jgi:hypothetical protein